MRSAKSSLVCGIVFAVLVTLPGCSDPDTNKLLFKPAVGSKRVVTVKQDTTQTMKLAVIGKSLTTTSGNEMTYLMSVDSVEADGTVIITATYVDVNLGFPGRDGGDDRRGALLKKMQAAFKDASLTLRVSRLGELVGIEGADALTEKVVGALGSESGPFTVMAKSLMRGIFSPDMLKASLYPLFIKAPDKALNASDTWDDAYTLELAGMPVTSETAYTLRGRASGYVTIDGNVTMKLNMADNVLTKLNEEVKMSGEINGNGTGVYSVDEATGWLTHREDKVTATGTMSMDMPKHLRGMPDAPPKVDLDMEMQIDLEVTNTAQQ
ncbi:MAG: hypothetical protein K1Y02_19440 [Candidatus Hydrogenedentes bacterium]|nr:hypothetical protein [Candidatus Hydrogenedentota bacterium]